MSKNKFPAFRELSDCARVCSQFQDMYSNSPRDSGYCHNLWVEVVKCQAVINFIEAEVGKLFDFSIPMFLPQSFVQARESEARSFLKPLQGSLNKAFSFVAEFVNMRQAHLRDFGENHKVAKKMKKILKNYDSILSSLRSNVEAWYESVRVSLNSEETAKLFHSFTEEKIRAKERDRDVFPGTTTLVQDLMNQLRQPDKAFNLKRVQILISAVEDIYESLKHEELKQLVKAARAKAKANAKGKAAKKNFEEKEEPPIEGLQQLGPFSISRVDDRFLKFMDFRKASQTLHFSVNVSKFSQKHDAEQMTSKLSPLSPKTITDPETLLKLKIPTETANLAFAYPIEIEPSAFKFKQWHGDKSKTKVFTDFLLNGGYVYFDSDGNVLAVNALSVGGSDLFFTGPHTLEPNQEKKLAELEKEDRWCEITIPALRKLGATKFAWLLPGEMGRNHGCFIYLYEGSGWPATYFDIVNVSKGKVFKSSESSNKLREILSGYTPGKV